MSRPAGGPYGAGRVRLPDRWEEIEPMLDALLDTDPSARAARIAQLAAGDAALAAELRHLLAECEHDTGLLNGSAIDHFDQLLSEESTVALPDVLGGRYRIERELGRGGMARVYLAEDLKHARHVAVKVVRPEVASMLGPDRFLREIGIIARLRHPNIMPLFDSGDDSGLLYFVMPHEAGQSLRARLKDGPPMTSAEIVGVLRDVARALVHAHAQGIVHRDVKPDNVMLSGGAAVVTDFGIAKAVRAARLDEPSANVSQVGIGIGTPAYMAPEQASGDPASDHRADIYSFGCLAFELYTHDTPLPGASLSLGRPAVSPGIARLIDRCLANDPAARPQSAQALLDALSEAEPAPAAPGPRHSATGRRVIFAAGTIAVVIAGLLIVRARRVDAGSGAGDATIAVLPLSSTGGDSLQPLVAEGLSDDIAAGLVRFPWLKVMSLGNSARYRGKTGGDLRVVGGEVGAKYLVAGAFREIDGRTTIGARLISAKDGSVIWAGQFDRPAALAVVRDEIVQAVAESLRVRVRPSARVAPRVATRPAHGTNETYTLYLIAKQKLAQRGQSVREAIDLFRTVLNDDSLSAEASSGLAFALAISPYFDTVSTAAVAAEATASARRALELDSTLAEPHIARGLVLMHERNWDRADGEFQKAVQLDPRDVEARVQYGRFLLMRDRTADGLHQFQVAGEDDHVSAIVSGWTAYAWLLLGRRDSAQAELAHATRINPNNTSTAALGALILLATGHPAAARLLVDHLPPLKETPLYITAASGDRATTMKRLAAMDSSKARRWLSETARAYAYLGLADTVQAIAAFERATDARELWPMLHPTRDPMFDAVRLHPRFRALLRRENLPDSVPSALARRGPP